MGFTNDTYSVYNNTMATLHVAFHNDTYKILGGLKMVVNLMAQGEGQFIELFIQLLTVSPANSSFLCHFLLSLHIRLAVSVDYFFFTFSLLTSFPHLPRSIP